MFEFQMQGPRHWRLQLGRWHFRTWRPLFQQLPRGYRAPETIYEVVSWNEQTDSVDYVLAAFDSESEALRLIDVLEAEGRHRNLVVNLIPVHARATDWEFDR